VTTITYERLRENLTYNPDTGEFIWNITKCGRAQKGDKTGTKFDNGYMHIYVDGHRYKSHRLAFLWMTGRFPVEFVDHINGIRDDNRWCNLREVSRQGNACNLLRHRQGHLVGASLDRRVNAKPWRAYTQVNDKYKHIGYYATEKEAHDAYVQFMCSACQKDIEVTE